MNSKLHQTSWRKARPDFTALFLGVVLALCSLGAAALRVSVHLFERSTGADESKVRQHRSEQKGGKSSCERWVAEEVPYIITAEERGWASKLATEEDCERFIRDFWERRNPDPGSPENKFRQQYYKRVAYAKEHFHYLAPGSRDDRARIYIQYGPPDKIEQRSVNGAGSPPFKERWIYNRIDGIGDDVPVEFTDPAEKGEYGVTTDPESLRRPTA